MNLPMKQSHFILHSPLAFCRSPGALACATRWISKPLPCKKMLLPTS